MSHPLLTAPIAPSLLRLAGPTTALMAVQIIVAIAETYYIGGLGTDSLAGFALVLPLLVMMMSMAAGGMGGGVAAAMARALGAGRIEDARALVIHALAVGVAFALLFAALAWILGPWFYALLGGSGLALEQALSFSDIWFGGALTVWISFFCAALLRGSGDAATPARYMLMGSLLYIPLSGVLALGLGRWPGWGIAGVAIASNIANGFSALLLLRILWRGRLGFMPAIRGIGLQPRLFKEILGVGLLGSLTTLIGNINTMLLTGLVGRFGVAALAGYSIGGRLGFMLTPLAFGIGTGLTTLVGVAVGAQAWVRAVKVAWTGGLIAFALIGALGWIVALLPESWSRLFGADAEVIAASVSYITVVAPFYCLIGLGLTLNFASQGAGRMAAPIVASLAQLAFSTLGGWLAIEWFGFGLGGVFAAIAAGTTAYGLLIAAWLALAPWRSRRGAATP